MERLTVLQQSVETILLFFKAIQSHVQNLVELHSDQMLEQLEFGKSTSPEERNELVNFLIRESALDIKVRFTVMQRLAEVYCEVSEQHILSGFNIIQGLSLLQSSMSDEKGHRSAQSLEDYRTSATKGIEGITNTVILNLPASSLKVLMKSSESKLSSRACNPLLNETRKGPSRREVEDRNDQNRF